MPDFQPLQPPSPYRYPTDLTIPQFILDEDHPLRPRRLAGSRWLVDDATGRAYGYEEVRERVGEVARAVRARWGIGPGDVVCIFSPNDLDYPIVIWALHRLGATVSCANPSYTHAELEHQLKETSSKLLFTCPGSLPTALRASTSLFPRSSVVVFSPPTRERTPEDCFLPPTPSKQGEFVTVQQLAEEGREMVRNYEEPRGEGVGHGIAFLSFSSGTTGLPKAIAIAHRNVIANVIQYALHMRTTDKTLPISERFARPGDVAIGVLPLYHIYGLVVNLHAVLFTGLTLFVVPKFNFVNMLESIVRYHITHMFIVPPHVVMFCNNPATKKYDLSHIRFAMVGAAPLSSTVTEKFKAIFPNMRMGQGYGMTETCTVVSTFLFQEESVNGSAGFLLPDTIARVVKENGESTDYGEPGELWVKGPQMAISYPNNKKATEETFLEGGWVRTGDEAMMMKDGNLYVLDRLKEILKVNGMQVAPAELEGHLVVHPWVVDAGVVGIPDDMRGELPLAFVVVEPSILKSKKPEEIREELKKWVRDNKVRYKWIEGGIEFVDAVPKNPSGKILRRILRDKSKEIVKQRVEPGKAKAKL